MVAQVFGVKKGNPVLRPEFTQITNTVQVDSPITDLVFVC